MARKERAPAAVESSQFYDKFARERPYSESYRRTRWGKYFHIDRRIGSIEAEISKISNACAITVAADIGCGDGSLLPALCKTAKNVVGYDISDECLEQARNLLDKLPNLSLKTLDLMKETPEQTFDLVVSSEVIEHVSEPEEFFRRLVATVKPGGHLVLTTPSRFGFREKTLRVQQIFLNIIQNRIRGRDENRWRFFHIGLLKVKELEKLAKEHFSEFSLHTVGLYIPVLTEAGFKLGGESWEKYYRRVDKKVGNSPFRWINWTQVLVARKKI